jgi:hypothetical protein
MGTDRFDGQSCQRWQKSKARKGRAPTTLETREKRIMERGLKLREIACRKPMLMRQKQKKNRHTEVDFVMR